MNPVFKAAASYFGLPADQVIDGEIADVWGEDITVLTVKIKLSHKDMQGIKDRQHGMEAIASRRTWDEYMAGDQPRKQGQSASPDSPILAILRKTNKELGEIGAATKQMAEQFNRVSRAGNALMTESIGSYMSAGIGPDADDSLPTQPEPVRSIKREVKHLHVDEEPVGDALPESVWVEHADVVQHQMAMASDYDEINARYLLQASMLTAEQRAKYCKPAPTSDAADFGGLPG